MKRRFVRTENPAYKDTWLKWVRTGEDRELRAMNTGVDPLGGFLCPEEFYQEMMLELGNLLEYRQYATVLEASEGTSKIPIPNFDGEASWVTENEALSESDETLRMGTLYGHKMACIQKVSEELFYDSFYDLEGFLYTAFGRSFGKLERTAFTTGNGIGKPLGWLNTAQVGTTAAAVDVIEPSEVKKLYFSVDSDYRKRGIWVMNSTTLEAVCEQKDATGRYIWPDAPDTIMKRPIVVSEDMPDPAAGTSPIGFGDFRYYVIMDRGRPSLQVLRERYRIESGDIGFLMFRRVDGKLVVPEAIKTLKMAAV